MRGGVSKAPAHPPTRGGHTPVNHPKRENEVASNSKVAGVSTEDSSSASRANNVDSVKSMPYISEDGVGASVDVVAAGEGGETDVETPGRETREVTPQVIRGADTPPFEEHEVTPEVVKGEVTPQAITDEVTPQVATHEVMPQVVTAEVDADAATYETLSKETSGHRNISVSGRTRAEEVARAGGGDKAFTVEDAGTPQHVPSMEEQGNQPLHTADEDQQPTPISAAGGKYNNNAAEAKHAKTGGAAANSTVGDEAGKHNDNKVKRTTVTSRASSDHRSSSSGHHSTSPRRSISPKKSGVGHKKKLTRLEGEGGSDVAVAAAAAASAAAAAAAAAAMLVQEEARGVHAEGEREVVDNISLPRHVVTEDHCTFWVRGVLS